MEYLDMSEVQAENEFSEEVLSADENSVTDEDRAEILKEIDKVVDENKIAVTKEMFELKPAKKGVFLPVLINILALAVIVGGFFLATWYFEQKQESMSTESESFLSAEGRLIAELKREAESQLQEKDNEIGQIQSQLDQIEQERTALMESMDQQVQEREAELRAALDRQLALEKSRLEALGRSAEDISGQLAELEQRVTAEQEAELNAFKSEAEETIRAKEAELERNKALTEQILVEARTERQELEEKSQAREEELVAQYEEEKAALAEQATEAETRLQQVTASQAREKLVSDQIIGTYDLISQKIESGNFTAAMTDLEQLKTLLYQPSVNALPNIAARRNSDLFIIDALEELVETRAAVEETKTSDSILQTANLLETARGAVARADDAFTAGDSEEAKRLYNDALNLVPSLGRAYTNLNTIVTEESRRTLTAGLSQGAALFEAENIDGAVSAYSQAVIGAAAENVALVRQAVEGISQVLSLQLTRQTGENRTVVTGLNRELTQEKNRVRELTAQGETLASENSSLTTAVNTANNRIAGLERGLTAEQTKASNLEDQLAEVAAERADLESRLASQTAKAADLEAKLSAQTAKVTDLEEELSSGAADSSDLQERLAAQTSRVSDLESQLALQNAQAADLETQLATQMAKVTELESRLALQTAQESDLEAQIAGLKTVIASQKESIAAMAVTAGDLEGELSAETAKVTELADQLAARAIAIDALTESLSAEKRTTADLAGELSNAESQTAALQELLREARADVADLQSELDDANETIAVLNSASNETASPVLATNVVDVQLEPLREAYDNAVTLLEPLLGSDTEDDVRGAKRIFSVFFERVNDLAFPGIYASWQEVDTAYIDLERGLAEGSGRTNALNEVIRYAEYIRTGNEVSSASRLAFDALSGQDLLYKRAFDSIAAIKTSADAASVGSWELAGRVRSFAAGKIQVEMDSGFAATPGEEVLVKRISETGAETSIAEGVVTRASGGVMEVDLRLYLVPTTPAEEDLVYLKISSVPAGR